MESSSNAGLSSEEALRRLECDGPNRLAASKEKGLLIRLIGQLNDPLIFVLLAAAGISFGMKEIADAGIICVVVMMNAVIGLVQEGRAKRALDALKELAVPHCVVVRDGRKKELPSAELVVGDLVCLESGCQIPADLELVEQCEMKVEEAALTGENLPVEKQVGDPVFLSTQVLTGHGMGIVRATGMNTQLGQIAGMLGTDKEELTPLQRRLGDLGRILSILALALCAVLFVCAVFQKRNIGEMLFVAISLAVAAVPEGLPAVVTICLARCVTRMAKANAIVRKLPSVETLGAVNVVCSDKTGTLTENCMTVETVHGMGEELFHSMLLCNDSEQRNHLGDPTELALLDYADKEGYSQERICREWPRRAELPFDSERKRMTTLHQGKNGRTVSYTKGAPDIVLSRCTHILQDGARIRLTDYRRKQIEAIMEQMAADALRMLGFAMKEGTDRPDEEELTFLGIVGMRDPIRPEVAEAVETFRQAGVRTVMITGDHADTALAIAKKLQIAKGPTQCLTGEQLRTMDDKELERSLLEQNISVFARVSPLQKVSIVKAFKRLGNLVAMTGDGVNDAPALKDADIGIAMGKKGTDVARQAADMILADDHFATIKKAIEEGRAVYENIRKTVIFLLSSNLGEILTMFVAVLFGFASPLKSSHILWVNLITDSLPALALGMDKNNGAVLMKNSPRKEKESLFARGGWLCTCFYGVLIAVISLSAFLLLPFVFLQIEGRGITIEGLQTVLKDPVILKKSQTYAFTVLGMSQLFHAVGMRDTSRLALFWNHWSNKLMVVAVVVGIGLQFAVTEVPFLVTAFGTARLSLREWALLAGLSAFPLLAHECIALAGKKKTIS